MKLKTQNAKHEIRHASCFMLHASEERGQALMTVVIFTLFISLGGMLGFSYLALNETNVSSSTLVSETSYYTSEGGLEDAAYRLEHGMQFASPETIALNDGTVSTTVTDTPTGKEIIAAGTVARAVRTAKMDLILGNSIAFNYGVQAGNGGFSLNNSAIVNGNVFSGGPIIGLSNNKIYGDVISAGASGLVYGIHATSSIYSHAIGNSAAATVADKNAYYQTITNTKVAGTQYPNSPDQNTAALPITDDQIGAWETDAAAGGTLDSSFCDTYDAPSNTCTVSSSKTLGPKKIPFNLSLKSSSGILTVTGHLWITGNITAQTGPTVKIASALGNTNVAIIADNPVNRTASGIITIGQSTIFAGSGAANSFVFMISQNNSSETGGTTNAIAMNQGASALVAYASHGQVTLSQSVGVRELTAYKIMLTQSANITYDNGLANTLFSGGPSGGFAILSWSEIQ